jgi:purine-cytosine permease-like protein
LAGVLAVMLAGWTTANPTLYRAGLALQVITPDWPRWKITLLAGIATSILAVFPVFFLRLLDYVAIYGLVLMPVGAVVFAEHWILPRLGLEQYRAEKLGWLFNWRAFLVWVGTLAVCWWMPFHLYFRWLPGYVLAVAAYTALQYVPAPQRVKAAAPASGGVS